MSLFQCHRCGCCENTALTEGYWTGWMSAPTLDRARVLNAVPGGAPLPKLCSACYVEPNFEDESGAGVIHGWHGEFERTFLPKGKFYTNPDGNLAHRDTHDTDFRKYALDKEDGK